MGKLHNLKFKDGEEGGDGDFPTNFFIEVVDNGYVLTTIYTDETEIKEVFISFEDLVKAMRADLSL